MRFKSFSCAFLALSTLLPGYAAAADWNQWRGPNRDSQLTESEWPDALNGRMELLWEKPHSPSYSGPVTQDGIVFTTETIDKTTERVTAYNLKTGDVVWEKEWPGAMAVPFFAASNGDWIRSTPAVSGDKLLILGMRDVLVCLDTKTGKENWRLDFPSKTGSPLPAFGAVCSPLIDGDVAYVQSGGALVKVSMADGKVLWSSLEDTKGMMSSGSFSSPVIATLAGKRQLVVQTRQALCGVDLDSGKVLWTQPIQSFRGMNILTPIIKGDRIFNTAHSGKAQLFEITKGDDDTWSVDEVWSQKSQGYMSSPVLIDDTIYLHQKNQRATALGTEDGEIRWTSSPFGKYWSMATNGQKILALDNSGELLLVTPSSIALEIDDRMKVADDSWAHIAIQDDLVIIRDLKALKVYQWK